MVDRPDAEGGLPLLVGHEHAEGIFDRAVESGRIAHAWLLTGPRGIGKATLATRMAIRTLATGDEADSGDSLFGAAVTGGDMQEVAGKVLRGAYPDFMVVTRNVDPETDKVAKDISVDSVRRVGAFLRLTSAAGGWRVVIVDSADDLNRNAANALLKILEEPPRNVLIILVSHAQHRLLPTIRSRCRQLPLSPLTPEATGDVLARNVPDADPEDLTLAAALSNGCPGRGIELLQDDGLGVFREVSARLRDLPRIDIRAIDALGDKVARAKEDVPFRRVFESFEWWVAALVRTAAAGTTEADRGGPDPETCLRLAALRGLEHWLEVWDKINRLQTRTESANLDRKQAVISAFNLLEAAARP